MFLTDDCTKLSKVFADHGGDFVLDEFSAVLGKALEDDEVLDVLQHLVIHSTKGSRALEPNLLFLLVVLVVILPDPSPLQQSEKCLKNVQLCHYRCQYTGIVHGNVWS